MPNYNTRSFARSPNEMKSSSDHINRKRSETIYENVIRQKDIDKNDKYIKLEGDDNNLKLKSIGGFNIKSYDLFLNVSRGRFYLASEGRNIELKELEEDLYEDNFPNSVKINNCGNTRITTNENPSAEINQRWDLFEGSFLVKKDNYKNNLCDSNILAKNKNVLIHNKLCSNAVISDDDIKKYLRSTLYSFARWNNNDPLRGFSFPKTFCI